MKFELRCWREEEYVIFFKHTRKERLQFYVFDIFPSTTRQCHDWVMRCCNRDSRQCFRAIIVNDAIVGCIGIRIGDGIHSRSGELFFWICQPNVPCDCIVAVIQQFCNEMFKCYHLTRIFSRPLCCHTCPQKILVKAGFCLEGTLCNGAFIGGECHNICLYAMCRNACCCC